MSHPRLEDIPEGAGRLLGHGAPEWAPEISRIGDTIPIGHVVWPGDPFGLVHAKRMMELAGKVSDAFALPARDAASVRYAALFSELGRTGYVSTGDLPTDAAEHRHGTETGPAGEGVTATVVEAAMKRCPPGSLPFDDQEWRSDVVRLVLGTLGVVERPEKQEPIERDRRLVCVQHAKLLEEARYMQRGTDWYRGDWLHVRRTYQRLVAPWAREISVQLRWLRKYGVGA